MVKHMSTSLCMQCSVSSAVLCRDWKVQRRDQLCSSHDLLSPGPPESPSRSTDVRAIFHAVPTDTVNNSDTLAALSKAMVEGVGKPEQVTTYNTSIHLCDLNTTIDLIAQESS